MYSQRGFSIAGIIQTKDSRLLQILQRGAKVTIL